MNSTVQPRVDAAPYFSIRSSVRAASSPDGIVLLDMSRGKYYSANSTGARILQLLTKGLSRSEIAEELAVDTKASADVIRSDLDQFLRRFVCEGLLEPTEEPPAEGRLRIRPSGPGKHPAAFPAVRLEPKLRREMRATRRWLADMSWFVRGVLTLARLDLLTRRGGFAAIPELLDKSRPRSPRPASHLVWEIASAVDRSASFYYRRRWCLQRAAACTLLLRRQGFAAELVLGVQVFPFLAHAWVELDGEVVSDSPELTTSFAVLDRI